MAVAKMQMKHFGLSTAIILWAVLVSACVSVRRNFNCECGIPNKLPVRNSNSRIIGGIHSIPHQYPWLTFLQLNGTFLCGASLISDSYVLSAAHCWQQRLEMDLLEVVMGQYNRCREEAVSVFAVNQIIPHPRFNERDFLADIMLVKLSSPVVFGNIIRPICLPPFDIRQDVSTKHVAKRALVVGWGKSTDTSKTLSCTPQKLIVPILSKDRCGEEIVPSLFCAGYLTGGKDSCQGDSGGPLQIFSRRRHFEIIGVVSNGIGCGLPNHPGFYTDITRYLPWIWKNIGDSLFCW